MGLFYSIIAALYMMKLIFIFLQRFLSNKIQKNTVQQKFSFQSSSDDDQAWRYHRQQNTLYPEGGLFCEENFSRYVNLCSVNHAYHKLKTLIPSIIGCEPITIFKKFISQYLSPLR